VRELAKLAEEAGLPLTHLALGFVLAHPGVTLVLIAPARRSSWRVCWPPPTSCSARTWLDRIDEIVPPGTEDQPGGQLHRPAPGARGQAAAPPLTGRGSATARR